jgi:urease accessory protein
MKTLNNDEFLNSLSSLGFISFSYTKSKKMIIGVVSGKNMSTMKHKINKIWKLYRESLNKKEFNLGKQ